MKKLALLCSAVLMVGLMAGCRPSFPVDSAVTATNQSPYVILNWSPAVVDEDTVLDSYRIDVDGVQVASMDPFTTTCELRGLDNDTTYDITVSAYDDAGQWSGPDNTISVSHLTQDEGDSGAEVNCYPVNNS